MNLRNSRRSTSRHYPPTLTVTKMKISLTVNLAVNATCRFKSVKLRLQAPKCIGQPRRSSVAFSSTPHPTAWVPWMTYSHRYLRAYSLMNSCKDQANSVTLDEIQADCIKTSHCLQTLLPTITTWRIIIKGSLHSIRYKWRILRRHWFIQEAWTSWTIRVIWSKEGHSLSCHRDFWVYPN